MHSPQAPVLASYVPLLGSFEAFLRALKQNVRYRYLLSSDLENVVKPNVALLRRECGVYYCSCLRYCQAAVWHRASRETS
jgi:hypothetical protein